MRGDRRISTGQAALMLGCSEDQVRKLIREGSLDAVDYSAETSARPSYGVLVESVVSFIERRKSAREKNPDGAVGHAVARN